MGNKTKWKHYVFVPEGASPETRGIRYGDSGFMLLCEEFREGRTPAGYEIHNPKFRPGLRGIDWSGFKEALFKEKMKNPEKPSIFGQRGGPPDHSMEDQMRRRMLWSVIREYHSPGQLAMDILGLLAHGRANEFDSFIASVRYRQPMIAFHSQLPPPNQRSS